jgi:hypothetical protein
MNTKERLVIYSNSKEVNCYSMTSYGKCPRVESSQFTVQWGANTINGTTLIRPMLSLTATEELADALATDALSIRVGSDPWQTLKADSCIELPSLRSEGICSFKLALDSSKLKSNRLITAVPFKILSAYVTQDTVVSTATRLGEGRLFSATVGGNNNLLVTNFTLLIAKGAL